MIPACVLTLEQTLDLSCGWFRPRALFQFEKVSLGELNPSYLEDE